MSRPKFVLSPEALNDLDEIWLRIAGDNVDAADRVEREIRKAIRLLAHRSEIGHERPDLTDRPLKFWTVYSYLIVYDADRQPIEIVRVLHGARNIPGVL